MIALFQLMKLARLAVIPVTLPQPGLDLITSGPSNLFIFINRNIRCLFLPDAGIPLMNMPVKMRMKAVVNYLLEHSAGQINSNKKEESLPQA